MTTSYSDRMMSYTDALSVSDPVHLVVTRTDAQGTRRLVGSHSLEWREVLAEDSGRRSRSVELSGVGSESSIPAGILDLRLELFPKGEEECGVEGVANGGRGALGGEVVAAQISLERQRRAEHERLFLVYAKQWWAEFLQVRREHAGRPVRIFARDESGRSRFVCSFVRPLSAGRLLDSPRHAARFVSLVPFERAVTVGRCAGGEGCGGEAWSSLHTLLCRRAGVSLRV